MHSEESLDGSLQDSQESGTDLSFTSMSQLGDDFMYMPTPEKVLKKSLESIAIPNKVCFTNLMQLDQFVQQINAVCGCNTPGCDGILVPTSVKSKGLGGAISVLYVRM